MQNGYYPTNLPSNKRRGYLLQGTKYVLIQDVLFKKNYDSVLLWCLDNLQEERVLNEFHHSPKGGNIFSKTTTLKIMRARYYWPSMFIEAHHLVQRCTYCQFFIGKRRNATQPLSPIVTEESFSQWCFDFMGMINPISSVRHKWILMVTDYITRWTKVIALKNATEGEIVNFLEEVVTKFGPPKTIIFNNARAFLGSGMSYFSIKNDFFLKLHQITTHTGMG